MAKAVKQASNSEPVKTVKRGSIEIEIFATSNTVNGKSYPQFRFSYYPYVGADRVRRRFADLGEATTEAELVATKLANGQHEVLELTSGDRSAYLQSLELLRPYDRPLFVAIAEYVDILKQLPQGVSLREVVADYVRRHQSVRQALLVPQLVEEYIAAKEKAGRSEAHLRDLKLRLRRFAISFSIPAAKVTGQKLQEWLDTMDASNRTKLNELRHVTALLRFAVRRKHAPRDVIDEVEAVERPHVTPSPTLIFTPDELRELFAAAKESLIPWLAVGAFCGLRSAEILRLDWRDVNLQRRILEVKAGNAKTAQRRHIPLCDAAVQWLTPHVKNEGRVACHVRDNWFYQDLTAAVNRARKAAGVKKKFCWKRNGVRHSYASYRLALTHDVAKVALECGNSAAMIFRHYRELCGEEEARNWFSILPVQDDRVVTLTQNSVAA